MYNLGCFNVIMYVYMSLCMAQKFIKRNKSKTDKIREVYCRSGNDLTLRIKEFVPPMVSELA